LIDFGADAVLLGLWGKRKRITLKLFILETFF
jgi:hypothetical protein